MLTKCTLQLTNFFKNAKNFWQKFINGEEKLVKQSTVEFQLCIDLYPSSNIMKKALKGALVCKD